jgi:hypothetical protein
MRTPLGRILLLIVCAVGFVSVAAWADRDDLSGGVFIVHHAVGMQYTPDPPADGWCGLYQQDFSIACCSEQNPRIDTTSDEAFWFVLSAWDEEKEFCGVMFGFGDYDPGLFVFDSWGACEPVPDGTLEISNPGWPGPNQGTALVIAVESSWEGNFVPVYYFHGYATGEGVIPLAPATFQQVTFIGWSSCIPPWPSIEYPAECYGSLGLLTDGAECCPATGPSPAGGTSWGMIKSFYK